MTQKTAPPRKRKTPAASARTPILEWIAGGVGLVLTLGLVGALALDALSAGDAPPDLRVSQTAVHERVGAYVVEVRVDNRGDRAAAAVEIEGELTLDGAEPEVASVTLDYVPQGSTRQAGLVFSQNPRNGRLALRALGYVDP